MALSFSLGADVKASTRQFKVSAGENDSIIMFKRIPLTAQSCARPIASPYITFVTSCRAVYFTKTFRISTAMLWQFVEIKYVKIKIKWIKKMLCMTLFLPSISHRRYESALLDRRHSKRKWVEKKVFSLIWIVFGACQCVLWRRRCGGKLAATTWLLCSVRISLTLTWVQGSCGWRMHICTAKVMTITLNVILNWVNVEWKLWKQSTQYNLQMKKLYYCIPLATLLIYTRNAVCVLCCVPFPADQAKVEP